MDREKKRRAKQDKTEENGVVPRVQCIRRIIHVGGRVSASRAYRSGHQAPPGVTLSPRERLFFALLSEPELLNVIIISRRYVTGLLIEIADLSAAIFRRESSLLTLS